MKKLFLSCALMLGVVATYGQGRINFANASTSNITTNNLAGTTGLTTGAGNYYFGLYVGTLGTPENALTLNILATNIAINGRLSGGNPAGLAAPHGDGATYPLTFQIRGWSSSGGLSYEQAYANALGGNFGIYLGKSAIGSVTPVNSPATTPVIFGTAAGQVGGFELAPVPEPSSIALGLLGLGAVALFRRRK